MEGTKELTEENQKLTQENKTLVGDKAKLTEQCQKLTQENKTLVEENQQKTLEEFKKETEALFNSNPVDEDIESKITKLQQQPKYSKLNQGEFEKLKTEKVKLSQEIKTEVLNFEKTIQSIFSKDPLSRGSETQLNKEYNQAIKSLKLAKKEHQKPFEDTLKQYKNYLAQFRLDYMQKDIEYYQFKLELCKSIETLSRDYIAQKDNSFQVELNSINSHLPDCIKEQIINTISRKKDRFLEKLYSELEKTQPFWRHISFGLIPARSFYKEDLIQAALARNPGFKAEKLVQLQAEIKQQQTADPQERANKSRAALVVVQIDNQLKESLKDLDLENLITNHLTITAYFRLCLRL